MEEIRMLNLISILCQYEGRKDEAEKYNEKALALDSKNLNAITCRAYYHFVAKDYFKGEKYNEAISNLKTIPLNVLVSKAEVAFACSKLGMDLYPHAVQRFQDVIKECDQHSVPRNYVCLWKFSLAHTVRRLLDISNTHDLSAFENREKRLQDVVRLYMEIIDTEDETSSRARAKAFAELGLLIEKHSGGDVGVLFVNKPKIEPQTCFEEALRLEPKDTFVLERSGTYYRMVGDVGRSIACLKDALEINETSYSHHHLALALYQQQVEQIDLNNCDAKEHSLSKRFCDPVDQMGKMNVSKTKKRDCSDCSLLYSASTNSVVDKSLNEPTSSAGIEDNLEARTAETLGELSLNNKVPVRALSIERLIPPEEVDKIKFHLFRAYELNQNWVALLQRGLLLRSLGEYEEAVADFKMVFNDESTSLAYKANAYEEAALCHLDLMKDLEDQDERKKELEHDAKMYFKKTIEFMSKFAEKDPQLRSFWVAFPTLQSMLLGQSNECDNALTLIELGNLSKKLMFYTEAFGHFKKALQLGAGNVDQRNVLLEICQLCLKTCDYDSAIEHLQKIPSEETSEIDRHLYITVYVKGALDSWKKGDTEMSRIRIENAFNCIDSGRDSNKGEPQNETKSANTFHVCILSSEESENKARRVRELLEQIGLNVTMNSDDVTPGCLRKAGIAETVTRSKHVTVFIGDSEANEDITVLHMLVDDRYPHLSVISESNSHARYPLFKRLPCLQYTDTAFGENFMLEDRLAWTENFLFMIADRSTCGNER